MDEQIDQSAQNDLDLDLDAQLEGSIDDLLDEIGEIVDEQELDDPNDTQDIAESADSTNASSASDVGTEALGSIEEIEESADALLDDTIDSLLSAGTPQDDTQPEEAAVVEEAPESEPESATEPVPAPETALVDELESAIDELVQPPVSESAAESAPEPEPEPEPIVENDRVMAIDSSKELAQESPIDTQNEQAAAETTEATDDDSALDNLGVIEDLDDALASAANDLLDGDFENAEGDLVEASTVDYAVDPSLLLDKEEPQDTEAVPEADTQSESASTPENEQETEAESSAEHAAEPELVPETEQSDSETAAEAVEPTANPEAESTTKTEAAPEAAPEPVAVPPAAVVSAAEAADEPVQKSEPSVGVLAKLGQSVAPIADKAVTASGPLGAKTILLLASPLKDKSPETRNAVGWVALWTMFLAVIVWGYALFFVTPSIPSPTQAPSRVVESTPTQGVTLTHEP